MIKIAAADLEWSLESAIATVLNKLYGIGSRKEDQTIALRAFVDQKDVFAILPTGFVQIQR